MVEYDNIACRKVLKCVSVKQVQILGNTYLKLDVNWGGGQSLRRNAEDTVKQHFMISVSGGWGVLSQWPF